MKPIQDDALRLVATAMAAYEDDAAAIETLTELDRRLREPLRLAIAGMVKAGKSTLLNAMLGEQIAPTDAGECTRIVTWYRYAATPSITLHPRDGEPRRLPVRRRNGQLVLELDGLEPEEVAWIDVAWPSGGLNSLILIDTPGIASLSASVSARSTAFLTPDDTPSSADAIVYLMRHLHASDVKFLESFRDTAAGASQTVNAVAVLSRADEVGSGRIDSMLSAGKVALRYEADGELAALALGVIPIAGLLAEGARTLRESEYSAFRELAAMERRARDRLLMSADRFTRSTDTTSLSEQVRKELLGRYGIFGVRLATALIRGGVSDSSDLAERMVQQSGLNDLNQFVRLQFRARAAALKTRVVLQGLEHLVRERRRLGTDDILAGVERLQANSHALQELSLLARARASALPLTPEESAAAERIVGGRGILPTARLDLPDDADAARIRRRAVEELDRWRARSQSPLTERAAVGVCRVVVRSLEEIVSELAPVAGGAAADVVLAGGPVQSTGHGAEEQPEQHEAALRDEELTKEHAVVPGRDEL